MLSQGDEILFNNNKYFVVLDVNYEGNVYYFVFNIKNPDDCLFCSYENGKVEAIYSKDVIDNLILESENKLLKRGKQYERS